MNKLSNAAKLKINELLYPYQLQITASWTSDNFNLYSIANGQKKALYRDQKFDKILSNYLTTVDFPTIVKIMAIFNAYTGGGKNMNKPVLFTSLKEVAPLLSSENINSRMVAEFWEIQIRKDRMMNFIKNSNGGKCQSGQMSQLRLFDEYSKILAKRMDEKGVDPYDLKWKMAAEQARQRAAVKVPPFPMPPFPACVAPTCVAMVKVQATAPKSGSKKIKQVIIDEARKVVVVKFSDDKVEVVKCSAEDAFDPYVGVSIAITRHMYETTSQFRRAIDKVAVVVKSKAKKEAKKEAKKAEEKVVAAPKRGPGRPRKEAKEGGK